jgi:hypothetical protein
VAEFNLTHYTNEPLELDPDRTYEQSTKAMKPRGLWVSVDGEYDWVSWCLSEEFNTTSLAHRTPISLIPGHNVLVLTTPEELDAFTNKYGGEMTREFLYIDWPRVAQDYDGLIITPYQWSRRYDLSWYYGWDCASGCIWNLTVVQTP